MVALLVSIGLIQIAGYYFAGAMVNGAGPLAIPQPDTALYMQSAARVAAGHPFSFSEGASVSTGSTTVLHPFIFSIPCLLGVHGFSLVSVFFWMNAFCYLVFLLGWGAVIWKVVPDFRTRLFAGAMLAAFPQTAYAAMAMSDIGLWLAVSGIFAAALSFDRRWLYGALLLLGPWVRPEGMVVAIAFFLVIAALRVFAKERCRRSDLLLAVLGLVSIAGVFALNYSLTGQCQFSSVARKGHFVGVPFADALCDSADDLLVIVRSLFFGQSTALPRHYYMIPIVGGLMFWLGAFVHDWRDWRRLVLPLAMAGGIWTVATSGWQNTNIDRYLAWLMPVIVMLMAEGYAFVAGKLRSRVQSGALMALPLLFAVGASVVFWNLYHSAGNQCDMPMKFGRELDRLLPADASVGLMRHCGMAFALENRRVMTLTGIYTPEFRSHLLVENLETLKNHPELRFSHWLLESDEWVSDEFRKAQGEVVAVGPDMLTAVKADWSIFDRAAVVPTNGVTGLELKFRVDVGDPEDEKRSMYEVHPRYGMRVMETFSKIAELGDGKAIDAGRVVLGFDEMFALLEPGKDVTVVMRTLRSADSVILSWIGTKTPRNFDFGAEQTLEIQVDGEKAAATSVGVAEKGFSDVVLKIPGSAVKNSVSRIGFMGDHIACCYWFFQ